MILHVGKQSMLALQMGTASIKGVKTGQQRTILILCNPYPAFPVITSLGIQRLKQRRRHAALVERFWASTARNELPFLTFTV